MAPLPPATFQVLPGEQSDLPEMASLAQLAFGDQELSQLVFGGTSLAAKEFRLQRLRRTFAEDPNARFSKVAVDGKVVAFAKWHIELNPDWHVEGQKNNKEKLKETIPPGANPEAVAECDIWVASMRKGAMSGKKHLHLSLLITKDEYQGRGFGSLLLKDGFQLADKHNIPIWLESSPKGHSLYRKLGFEDVEVYEIDLTKFGGKTVARFIGMTRPPKGEADV